MQGDTVLLAVLIALVAVLVVAAISIRQPWLCLLAFWTVSVAKLWLLVHVPVTETIDPTALVAILIACVFCTKYLLKGWADSAFDKPTLFLHVGYAVLMLITLMWTTAPHYGLRKALRFSVFSLILLAGPMILLGNRTQAKRMGQSLIVLGAITALIILVSPSYELLDPRSRHKLRMTALGGDPLVPAFVLAVAAVLAVTGIGQARAWFRILSLSSFPLMLIAIYRTGSRAMFFQVFLGIGIWLLVTRSRMRWVYRILLMAVIIQAPMWLEIIAQGAHTERISRVMESPTEAFVTAHRWPLWKYVLANAPDRPVLGHGVGSFAMDYMMVDEREYPHNLFLEALYEQGAIGVGLLSAFLGLTLFRYASLRKTAGFFKLKTPIEDTWFATSVSALASMLVHWDLADVRLLWFCLGMLVSQCVVSRRKLQEQPFDVPSTA